MIGPIAMILGSPAALLASLSALSRAPDKGFAMAALVLSVIELSVLGVGIVASLLG